MFTLTSSTGVRHMQRKIHLSATKTSRRCITQLAKMSIDPKCIELTAHEVRKIHEIDEIQHWPHEAKKSTPGCGLVTLRQELPGTIRGVVHTTRTLDVFHPSCCVPTIQTVDEVARLDRFESVLGGSQKTLFFYYLTIVWWPKNADFMYHTLM